MSALLAVSWEWELRGTLIVIIAVGVLCGSLYLILGTNLGARLGFLVALTALAGWMFLMGAMWWTYGKGLLGPGPSWKPVAGKTIIRDQLTDPRFYAEMSKLLADLIAQQRNDTRRNCERLVTRAVKNRVLRRVGRDFAKRTDVRTEVDVHLAADPFQQALDVVGRARPVLGVAAPDFGDEHRRLRRILFFLPLLGHDRIGERRHAFREADREDETRYHTVVFQDCGNP